MKEIITKVFEFNELSYEAKEKARDWYREGALDYEWWEYMYDDAERAGLKISSFDLDRRRGAEGEFIDSAEDCASNIFIQHGQESETYKTAVAYQKERTKITLETPMDDNGDPIDVYGYEAEIEDLDKEFLRSILEDYSIMLQHEYEWLLSDEAVDESIIANQYTFTEDGKREG